MRILIHLFFLVTTFACASAQTKPSSFVAWDRQDIDLGPVKKGEKREMDFTLTNTSGQDIRIDLVDACECTTTDYPRGSIAPGKTAVVHAVFDSTEKEADETITIRVIFTNTDAEGNPRVETVQYRFQLIR